MYFILLTTEQWYTTDISWHKLFLVLGIYIDNINLKKW